VKGLITQIFTSRGKSADSGVIVLQFCECFLQIFTVYRLEKLIRNCGKTDGQ